jgi:putative hemolysin
MDFPLIAFLILLGLVLVNGVFALAEIAMVSSRPVRLKQHAEEGRRGASAALELSRTPSRFLSTIQVGITLVGVLSGAFGEATLAAPLESTLGQFAFLAPYARWISVITVVVGTTYLSLVLGELAPKQIALTNPERFASLLAPPMHWLSRAAAPLVTLLSKSANGVLRLLRVQPSDEPAITEEEIRVMLTQGLQSGVVAPIEEQIASQAFWLGDQRISALATPRPDILWLDPSDPMRETIETIRHTSFSQYPVADGSLDNLLGIVDASDLLSRCMGGEPLDLRVLVKPALLVPETLRAYQLLERFKESRTQFALTLDEYGGVQGLVTALDLLESLVGELPEADDVEDPDIVRREDGSYLLDGLLGIDRFKNLFGLKELPEQQPADYETINGLLMTVLGRIPHTGDKLELPGVILEVMDMDGNRVDKVLAASRSDEPAEE